MVAGALRPEQRLDKNGKLVTRHVRTAPQPGAHSSIPAPGLATATTEQRHEQLAADIRAALPGLGDAESGGLGKLRAGTLRAVRDAAVFPGVPATLIDVLKNELRSGDAPRDEAKLHLSAVALPVCAVLREYGMSDVSMLHGDLNGALNDGGLDTYRGPVDDREERLAKAYAFSYVVGLSRWQHPLRHDFVLDVQRIADRISDVEACLPLLGRALASDYVAACIEDIEAALDAAQRVAPEDRESLARFMLDRGETDIPAAAATVRGAPAALQNGAL